jgi:hypothetical protein
MKKSFLFYIVIVLLVLGCNKHQSSINQNLIFEKRNQNMGVKASNCFEQVILHDVHGLYGGQNLYLNVDGQVVMQIVRPNKGLQEERYSGSISKKMLQSLKAIIKKHKFFEIEIPDRLGIPDEARPAITIKLLSGESKTISKWAGDSHPDFDAIYGYLFDIVKKASKACEIYKGSYDYDWRPEEYD